MKPTLFFVTVVVLLVATFPVFSQWTQLNNDINGSTADDRLGSAVTLSANGNRIATGAPLYNNGAAADAGQVRLYEQQGAIWTVIAQYAGAAAGDGLGTSVSLSADGNRLAVGAPLNDAAGNNAGQVYLYHYTAGSWSLITTLNGELANDQFASSVSLSADGMRLAVGAPFNDAGTGNAADNRGRVRLYQYNGASWVAFPNALANSINGLAAGDQSGRTVSLSTDGSRVAIGAPLGDGGFADSGYTRIFQYNSGNSTWEQLGSALNGEAAGDQSGAAVSLSADGNRVAIGAPLNDADSGIATDNPGHVRVYQYSAGAWTQVGTDLNGYALGDQFGKAVSLNTDGSRLAIGAPFANGSAGQTQVYQLHGSSWLPLGVAFNGEAGGDEAGSSVSLSAEGSRVAIGAPLNDGGGLSAGQVRLYEYAIPDTSLGEGAGTDASGQANMFLGYYSGHNTTTGSDNTFVGTESGYSNSTGNRNTFVGGESGYSNTTGYENAANGFQTLYLNTTGIYNTAAGFQGLYNNTTGSLNTATGHRALYFNSTGGFNMAMGYRALYNNTEGWGNTANGSWGLYNNTTGSWNTATGIQALYGNTTGDNNTAVGAYALSNQTYSNGGVVWDTDNVAVGYYALYNNNPTANNNGYRNTAIGRSALAANTTGIRNTAVGYYAGTNAGNYNNTTAVGNDATVNASNKVRLGNASVTTIEGQVAYTFPSDGRFKTHIEEKEVKGLDFINRLRPVVYNFDTRKFTEFLTQNMPDSIRRHYLEDDFGPSTAIRQSGFIAQEVEKAAQEAGYTFNGLHKPDDENDNYSLAYSLFVVPLVKAVQEQQQQIETQQQQLEEQKQENEVLRQKLEAIESVVYGTTKTTQSKTSGETQAPPGGFALYQNVPNPFTQTTVIAAQLPENVQQAKIVVYNLQGLELASYPLGERGKVSVEISGGRFPAGMYLYALLADGQVIDTKKMVLTN